MPHTMVGPGCPGRKLTVTGCTCPFPMMLVAWTPDAVVTVPVIEIVVVHACPGSAGTAWTHMEG